MADYWATALNRNDLESVQNFNPAWTLIETATLGNVGTAGTSVATVSGGVDFANQLVLVPRGDQLDNGIAWSEPQMVYQYGSESVWDTVTSDFGCVVGSGTGYFMFQNGFGTVFQVVVLESADGIAWGTGRRAIGFNQVGSWDTGGVYGPSVLIDGGTTWKMWISAQEVTVGTVRITYATSADGLSWTVPVESMNVGSVDTFDSGQVAYPSVIRDGAGFKMVYFAFSGTYQLAFATSTDGITWVGRQAIIDTGSFSPWDDGRVVYPFLAKDGTNYKLWYCGGTASGNVLYATSLDCINWSIPRLSFGGTRGMREPSVIDQTDYWQMWLGANEYGTSYFATSMGTPDNNIIMWDMWDGTVLTTLGTSIKFRPSVDAAFVGPAYYFENFGPKIKVGMINNASEIQLENVYVDIYVR